MSDKTKIAWATATWNPVTGCTPVSEGCDHCYAERLVHRFKDNYPNGFQPTYHPQRLGTRVHWRMPRRIFLCSMGDLFHPSVKEHWVTTIFRIIESCPRHTFMVLTKRPERMRKHTWCWPDNLWAGVTVELAEHLNRLDLLTVEDGWTRTEYPKRFLSCEPLLGPIPGIMRNGPNPDWVIVGCESGPGRRPMDPDWAREIRDQCVENDVPFFLKQMDVGGKLVKMPELDGQVWAQRPKG